jgi:hypothetical protein
MEHGKVAEVRGIDTGQNLEPAITDIAMERVQDLPGGQKYLQAAEDMNRVTDIETRARQGEELTARDVYFLYECGGDIQSFGYGRDPRIGELLQDRDPEADLDMMLEEFDHAELAREMMRNGEEKLLAQNLDKFRPEAGYHAELAHNLLESGAIGRDILAQNLDKFPDGAVDHAKFARNLLESGPGDQHILTRNLDKFPEGIVDHGQLARYMMNKGSQMDMVTLAENLDKFWPTVINHSKLARELLESGFLGPKILTDNLDKFQELPDDVRRKMGLYS